MKKTSFLLIIFTVITACKSDNKIDTGQKFINVDLTENEQFVDLSEIVDSVSFISLENNGENIVGNIDKLIVEDSLYIVVDKEVSSSTYLFNKNGKYLHRIGDLGKSKSEYVSLSDVTTDGKNIFVLDNRGNKVNSYSMSGDFLESFDFKYAAYSFQHISGKKFIFYCDYAKNYDLTDNGMLPNVIIYDFETDEYSLDLLFESSLSSSIYPASLNNLNPYLHETMGRDIYVYDNEKLLPYIKINYNNDYNTLLEKFHHRTKDKQFTIYDFSKEQAESPLPILITFLDYADGIFTFHTKGSYLYYNLFSTTSDAISRAVGNGTLPIKDDIYKCIRFMPKTASNGILYCDLDPMIDDITMLPIQSQSDGNPIIVKLYMKTRNE